MEVEDTKVDYTNSDRLLETLTSHMRLITIQEKIPKKKANSLAQPSIEKILKAGLQPVEALGGYENKS